MNQSKVKLKQEKNIGFYSDFRATIISRPFHDEYAPSDEAKLVESWPTTRSTISFKENHLMKIGDSTRLLDFAVMSHDLAIVSHDLVIVSFDRAIIAFPPSDRRRCIEVSPRVLLFHRV